MVDKAARSSTTETLIVALERSPGSGVFVVDERLRAEEVLLAGDETISTARIAVRLDETFDTAAARARYHADLRLVVRTEAADPADQVVLFEGYPPIQNVKWHGGPGRGEESFSFDAEHVYARLSRDRESWIYGRRMRNGEIEDGLSADPSAWAHRSVLIEALPCVFNLDGAPNCSPTPLTVTAPDGSVRSIYIFTFDDDPDAIPWTYLNALRYLFWFYAPREGPVFEGNLFGATDAYVDRSPSQPGASSSRLIDGLNGASASLNCEAANLVEALAMLADAAGVHVTADSVGDATSVRSELRIWAVGDGARRSVALAPHGLYADGTPRFDASSLSAAEIFTANNVARAALEWDARRLVNAPIVIGDVKAYEMTVPLAPGWLPTQDLDNVDPADRTNAKEKALTPKQVEQLGDDAELSPWYRKYHRDGSEFAQNRYVSRRWVLNEDGRFDGATHNRNAPFDDYQPYDFSTVTSGKITRRGVWSRRSRALLATITRSELGARFGVYVEVSFDSGGNWHKPTGPIAVVRDPTAIVFEVANPTAITPPGVDPLEQNMWYAIIDQTFRVRVTALIESDDRLIAQPTPNDGRSPTLQRSSRVVYAPRVYRFFTRQGTTNVLANVNPDATDIDRDDSTDITAAAETIMEGELDRRVSATPTVPWLDTEFSIGDEVAGVRGRGLSFVTRDDGTATGPVVVGKRYRFGEGRWETALILDQWDGAR